MALIIFAGATHKRLRRIMVPAFATQQMHPLMDVFTRAAEDVKDRWIAQIADNGGHCDFDLGLDCGFALLNAIGEGSSVECNRKRAVLKIVLQGHLVTILTLSYTAVRSFGLP